MTWAICHPNGTFVGAVVLVAYGEYQPPWIKMYAKVEDATKFSRRLDASALCVYIENVTGTAFEVVKIGEPADSSAKK